MPWYRPRSPGSSRGGRASTIPSTFSMRSSTQAGRESSASETSSSKRGRSIMHASLRPLHGKGGDGLHHDAMREHRRDLALVVRRADLDDVHADEVDPPHDLADRAEHLAGQGGARRGGGGP